MKLNEKIDVVKDMLANKKVAIGFSGGADSTLLAYLSSQVSKDTLAITIDNHLLPINFIDNTKEIAKTYNIKHEIIDLDFYNEEEFLKNTSERCFNCRDLMYTTIKRVARDNGFDFICDGNNISDLVNNRPGILITYRENFKTPFIKAKLTSKEIHEYLDKNNISYSKSTTCLATRIQTDTSLSKKNIERIKYCEDYILTNTNCKIVKLRNIGEFGICEVDNPKEIMKDGKFKQINDELKSNGFKKIALNLTPIDDNEYISLDYAGGSFKYKLPFTINLKKTLHKLGNEIIFKSNKKIKLEKITIYSNGLIKGENFKSYDEALDKFMDVLSKLRRNV